MSRPTAWPSQYADDRFRVSVSSQSSSARSSTGLRTLRPDRVQEDLRRPDQAGRLADGRAAGLRRAQVGDQRLDLAAGLLGGAHHGVQVLLVHVDERDPRALGGQAQRAGPAEPAGAADQGRPSVEREPVLHGAYPSSIKFSYYESRFLNTVADPSRGCPGSARASASVRRGRNRLRSDTRHRGGKATHASPPRQLLIRGAQPASAGRLAQRYRAQPSANGRSTASRPSPRACASCRCSTSSGPSWRVSDLATAAGLPMPTVYRVVMTLASEGYLDHLPNGDYRPGVRTLTLGTAALRSLDLVAIATPKLHRARRADRGDGEPGRAQRRPRPLPRSGCATPTW